MSRERKDGIRSTVISVEIDAQTEESRVCRKLLEGICAVRIHLSGKRTLRIHVSYRNLGGSQIWQIESEDQLDVDLECYKRKGAVSEDVSPRFWKVSYRE